MPAAELPIGDLPIGSRAAPNPLIWQDSWGAFRVGPRRLAPGAPEGPLRGLAFVVDDLIDVRGEASGAGSPAWLAEAAPARESAAVVNRLAAAGATCVGKTHVDEFGLSLRDARLHSTVVRNPVAPERDCAGASRGAAAAVAAGIVGLAIGRDTGGALSVAAASCGLVAVHPSRSRVDAGGVLPVAPAFDALGWTAATLELCLRAGEVLLADDLLAHDLRADDGPPRRRPMDSLLMIDAAALGVDERLAAVTEERVRQLAAEADMSVGRAELRSRDVAEMVALFRDIHVAQTWALLSGWAQQHAFALSSTTAVALRRGSTFTAAQLSRARRRLSTLARRIERRLADAGAILVMPAASELPILLSDAAPAPPADAPGPARPAQFATAAGLTGVTLPIGLLDGAPIAAGFWAPAGGDEALWDAARALDRGRASFASPPAKGQARRDAALVSAC